MRIDAGTRNDAETVALAMRDSDFREFSAVSWAEGREALARQLADAYGAYPGLLCASIDDEPTAVGAMVQVRPGVATLLFYATPAFPRIALAMTRFVTKTLFPVARQNGVHRIECVSIEGYDEAHKWIETLGLTREAVLRGYGKGGETFHQFSWVAS